jgi:hypothetical protein
MPINADASRKNLTKRAKKGNRGYPLATIIFYGPDDKTATKAVVGILAYEGAGTDPIKRWVRDTEVRGDNSLWDEMADFIKESSPVSIVIANKILGCPHEEGKDYPLGEVCPACPYWAGRDRFAGIRPIDR